MIQEGINLPQDSILENHFVQIIVGRPGSGKSYYIEQLLTNPKYYNGKFDFNIIMTPSKFQKISPNESNFKASLDINWLFNKLNEISKIKSEHKLNVLVVMDDIVSQLKEQEKDQLLNNLFMNRRHILPNATISILLTTQKYNLVPLRFRTMATSLILFDINNKEFDTIKGEHFKSKQQGEQIKQLMNEHYRNIHNYLYIVLVPHFKIHTNETRVMLKEDLYSKFVQGIQDNKENNQLKKQELKQEQKEIKEVKKPEVQNVLKEIKQNPVQTPKLTQTNDIYNFLTNTKK